MRRTPAATVIVLALTAVLALALIGCGSDGSEAADATPARSGRLIEKLFFRKPSAGTQMFPVSILQAPGRVFPFRAYICTVARIGLWIAPFISVSVSE